LGALAALHALGRIAKGNMLAGPHPALFWTRNLFAGRGDIAKTAHGHRRDICLAHLRHKRKSAVDLDRLLIRANARALREDKNILPALQGVLRASKTFHICGAALDGNAASAREHPLHDAMRPKFTLKNRTEDAAAAPQVGADGDHLCHRGVVADNDGALTIRALEHIPLVFHAGAPHAQGERPHNRERDIAPTPAS